MSKLEKALLVSIFLSFFPSLLFFSFLPLFLFYSFNLSHSFLSLSVFLSVCLSFFFCSSFFLTVFICLLRSFSVCLFFLLILYSFLLSFSSCCDSICSASKSKNSDAIFMLCFQIGKKTMLAFSLLFKSHFYGIQQMRNVLFYYLQLTIRFIV